MFDTLSLKDHTQAALDCLFGEKVCQCIKHLQQLLCMINIAYVKYEELNEGLVKKMQSENLVTGKNYKYSKPSNVLPRTVCKRQQNQSANWW